MATDVSSLVQQRSLSYTSSSHLQHYGHMLKIASLLAGRNCVRLRPVVPRCSLREDAGEHSLQHFVPRSLPSICILVPSPVMLSWHQHELHAGMDRPS